MNQIIFIWLIIHGQDDIFWLVCNGNNSIHTYSYPRIQLTIPNYHLSENQ